MIILGCYANGRIHVFNVRDERIADAKYVTSAHEMLHAAYVRLSKDERKRVGWLLDEAYQYASKNEELREVMDEYSRVEPDQRYNELHSILGTEYAELSPELEKYYSRYFIDRRKIVDMAVKYRKVFKNLEAGQAVLKVKLDRLAVEIEADASLFDTMISWLNRDIDNFNAKTFNSRSEFNAEREALIEKQSEIKRLRAQIEANILQHDELVKEYNSLGGKINQLNYQLDSKSQIGVRAIP
jgi:chromosome segregation ATPase